MDEDDKTDNGSRRSSRKLCVVFADMIGYSALSSIDEHGTHRMWMDFNANCLIPTSKRHKATVIRLFGDGCLLSFEGAQSALDWCLEVRSAVIDDRSGCTANWPKLSMRFGAHVCDVIEENGDIYGDGVNITKRLQERAEADGILISERMKNELGENLDDKALRFLGHLEYKNIERSVPTYEFRFAKRSIATRKSEKAVPGIAIMPFKNTSGEADFDYFCDGMIDDIIHSLASLKELLVIARSSTLPFAGQVVDARDISRILSVRYVLQGTLRLTGDKIRLSVAFEDAETGETIFGEKSDFYHSAIFDVQDKLVQQIVSRITPGVRALELETALRKPPTNFTAYQCYLRALDLMKELDRSKFEAAREFLDKAIAMDEKFALALAWIVRWYCLMLGQNWLPDREAALEEVQEFARRGMAADRDNPMVLASIAHVKSYLQRDYDTAMVYFDRARQIAPSNALVWILSSATLSYMGRGSEAVEHAQMAMRLSPNDPDIYQFYDFASIASMIEGEPEAALNWAKLSYAENPKYKSNLIAMVALYEQTRQLEKAGDYAKKLLKIEPEFTVTRYRISCPLTNGPHADRLFNSLKVAGLPE